MRIIDFDLYSIRYFVPREITKTGADIEDVSALLIKSLDCFRKEIGEAVVILSLTTGNHYSEYHASGLAVDIAFHDYEYKPKVSRLVYAALKSGFKGIGVYHNGTAYSLHLDMRPELAMWLGHKRHREKEWKFKSLIADPKDFAV